MSEKPEHLFDSRTVERNLKNGRITRREYESFMGHLPDTASKSEPLFVDEPEAEEAAEQEEQQEE